jgi:hypothetical protein
MTVFLTRLANRSIAIQATALDPEKIIGDLTHVVGPGESVLGIPYRDWAKLGEGKKRVTIPKRV